MTIKKTVIGGLTALALLLPVAGGSHAQGVVVDAEIIPAGQSDVTRYVDLGLHKSMIVELASPASDVVITNPEIADASVQTAKRIIFRGIAPGETNALIFDRNGKQILDLELSVSMDMAALHKIIERHLPEARVKIEGLSGSVVMTGYVNSLAEADQVERLVSAYVGAQDASSIVNMIEIGAKDQVLLQVRIVEMQRNAIKQLGINLNGRPGFGDLAALVESQLFADLPDDGINASVNTGTTTLAPGLPYTYSAVASSSNGYAIQGRALGGLSTEFGYVNYDDGVFQSSAGLTLDTLERIGVVRTLAEPTIVAMSGESGKFLAGGEFPVPVGQTDEGLTVEFKPYGVGLGFTPVVLSEGRISLKISTEVSELTSNGAYQGQSQTYTDANGNVTSISGATLPALSVRRAESVVELPSGGSMMLAGLIQSRSRQNIDQLPGLEKLPVLGALFRSRDFVNEESELVIIVTPLLVDPASMNELRTPDKGFANASDAKTILFGKLNEQYGRDGAPLKAEDYRAPVGFIEE